MSDSDEIVRDARSSDEGNRMNDSFNERDNFANTGRLSNARSDGGFSGAQATGRSNVSKVSRNSGMPPHRAQRNINQGRSQNKQAVQKQPQQIEDEEQVRSVQSLQTCITGFNVLTVFCDVIFLQILMLKNAVPMTDGILMNAASSVTYFVMSLVSLIFLYANHEAVSYMVLDFWGIVALLYGLIILTLGIVCLAVDLSNIIVTTQTIWSTLSDFQKDYFENSQINLIQDRSSNTQMAGFFAIIIGVMILVMAVMIFVLKIKQKKMLDENVKWNPGKEMKSRGITVQTHQVCAFAYNKSGVAPQNLFSAQINIQGKKEEHGHQEDSESHSESSFNSGEEDQFDYKIKEFNEEDRIKDQLNRSIGNSDDDSDDDKSESDDSDSDNEKRSKKKSKKKKKKGGK